jgi:hypothetical protein
MCECNPNIRSIWCEKCKHKFPQINKISIGRRYELFNKDCKKWEIINFKDLRKDDLFRIFDNDVRYSDENGNNVFIAKTDTYMSEEFKTLVISTYY